MIKIGLTIEDEYVRTYLWERGLIAIDEDPKLREREQEPVAWYRDEDGIRIYYETKVWDDCTPLYTTPQQRTWVGLTNEEIDALEPATDTLEFPQTVRAIEAKLKEKNNG
jgi:hypothetical protein